MSVQSKNQNDCYKHCEISEEICDGVHFWWTVRPTLATLFKVRLNMTVSLRDFWNIWNSSAPEAYSESSTFSQNKPLPLTIFAIKHYRWLGSKMHLDFLSALQYEKTISSN